MRTFHANWAYVVIVLNLAAGLWGLVSVRRRPPAPKAFWPLVHAGQLALAVQVVLGVLLTQRTPATARHMFYGFVVAIAAVLAFAFRTGDRRRNITVFSAVALFVGAVSIRAMFTA